MTNCSPTKIISAPFTTKWEIKARSGVFYLMGSTETNNGFHKMIFICDGKGGIDIDMLYNTTGEYMEEVLKFTSTYEMEIDGKELTLASGEIKERVEKSGPEYASVVVHITDRIYQLLLSARVVRFMMVPPSHAIYAGWDSDFASGHQNFLEFAKTCRR